MQRRVRRPRKTEVSFLPRIAALIGFVASTALAFQKPAGRADEPRIWTGVYTVAQAERGKSNFEKSCSSCHNEDLNGSTRGPALIGAPFLKKWDNASARDLFAKLRDSMPAGDPEGVSPEEKIDILAYLLQANGFPGGSTDLNQKELDDIRIVQKGKQTAPNFALTAVIGCLTPRDGTHWTLTQATEPVVTNAEKPSSMALKEAGETPLSTGTFDLLNTVPFQPTSHAGQKVEARGLLYRDPGRNLLNLVSLETTGKNCGN